MIIEKFSQVKNMNYEQTFASTIKFNILRFFLIIVALHDLECYQVNVNNVFIENIFRKNHLHDNFDEL